MKTLFLALCVTLSTLAAQQKSKPAPTLEVGDAAPALQIAHWMHGEELPAFEQGKLYLIEFLSVRSPRCRGRLEFLDAIARKWSSKGLRVIGVTGEHFRNARADVEKLIAARGKDLSLTIAWDRGRASAEAFMKAVGRRKLPATFLVDRRGRLAYVGRRWAELAIAGVVEGDWSPKVGAERIKEAKRHFRLMRALVRKQPGKLDEALAQLRNKYPFHMLTPILRDLEFTASLKVGNFKRVASVGEKIVASATRARDAGRLNNLAWTLVDPKRTWSERNLSLALNASQAAVRLTRNKNAALLDTLARTWAWKKNFEKALETQKAAIKVKDGHDRYRKTLAEYEAALKNQSDVH